VLDAAAHEFLRTEALSGRGSTRLVSSLVASMRSVGWDGPPINVVVIAGQMYILDGHHRTHAARLADILVRYRTIPIESLPAFGYDSADEVISAWTTGVLPPPP